MSKLTLLAVAPAVYLLYLIYRLDKKEKEPIRFIVKLAFFGALMTIPAAIIEGIGEALFATTFELDEPIAIVLFYTLVVAGTEELVKMLVLYFASWKNPSFNCRFDGVVYASAVSLGFALLENVTYVLEYGVEIGIVRALTAVPLHCAAGIYMGEFYGNAKKYANKNDENGKSAEMAKAYFLPVLLHGAYDSLCSFEGDIWIGVFLIFVIVMYIVTIKNVRRYSENDVFIGANKDAVSPSSAYACLTFGVRFLQDNLAYAVGRAKSELLRTNIYSESCHAAIIDSMLDLSPAYGFAAKIRLIEGGAKLYIVQNGAVVAQWLTSSDDDVVFFMLDYTIGVIASMIVPSSPFLSEKIRNDAFARIGGIYNYWHICGRSVTNMSFAQQNRAF